MKPKIGKLYAHYSNQHRQRVIPVFCDGSVGQYFFAPSTPDDHIHVPYGAPLLLVDLLKSSNKNFSLEVKFLYGKNTIVKLVDRNGSFFDWFKES